MAFNISYTVIEKVKVEVIDTAKFTFRIFPENSYLEYCIKEGATIDAEDVIEGKRMVTEMFPGLKFFVMAEGINFFTLTSDARKVSATPEHSDNTIAVAFFTTNISVLLLGEMYNKINKPVVPTKVFNNRENAKEWLKHQMVLNGFSPCI